MMINFNITGILYVHQTAFARYVESRDDSTGFHDESLSRNKGTRRYEERNWSLWPDWQTAGSYYKSYTCVSAVLPQTTGNTALVSITIFG